MTHFCKALLLTAACTFAAQAQTPPPHDTVFSGVERFEKNATSVTHVENDGSHHHSSEAASDPNEPRRLSTVYVFKYDKPGLYSAADVESFRQKVRGADWTCKTCPGSGTASAAGKLAISCTRPVGTSSQEYAVIVQRPLELTFLHGIGRHSSDSHDTMTCNDDR